MDANNISFYPRGKGSWGLTTNNDFVEFENGKYTVFRGMAVTESNFKFHKNQPVVMNTQIYLAPSVLLDPYSVSSSAVIGHELVHGVHYASFNLNIHKPHNTHYDSPISENAAYGFQASYLYNNGLYNEARSTLKVMTQLGYHKKLNNFNSFQLVLPQELRVQQLRETVN